MLILLILYILALIEIVVNLKKQIASRQKQINELCKRMGENDLDSYYVTQELNVELKKLKDENEEVKAIKILREQTNMDLVQAKQFYDQL